MNVVSFWMICTARASLISCLCVLSPRGGVLWGGDLRNMGKTKKEEARGGRSKGLERRGERGGPLHAF